MDSCSLAGRTRAKDWKPRVLADIFVAKVSCKSTPPNLPFEEWTEVLGSERSTGATLDRLTHRCPIVETGRESYRLRDARRRRLGEAASLAELTIDAAADES